MAERKQYAKWAKSLDANRVGKVTYSDGKVQSFDLKKLSQDMLFQAAWFGVKQKIPSDASAVDNLVEFKAVAEEVWSRISGGGTWEADRDGFSRDGTIAALIRASNNQYTKEQLDALDDESLKEYRSLPQVKVALREIALEKAREAAKTAQPLKIDLPQSNKK